jgi:hypothetical protein
MAIERTRRILLLRRGLLTLAIAGCLFGIGLAFSLHQDTRPPLGCAGVESLTPAVDSKAVPGQTPVIVDLPFGWTGQISINGQAVIQEIERAQAILRFTPGPDKEIRRFENGPNIASVTYWPIERETDKQTCNWKFNVV